MADRKAVVKNADMSEGNLPFMLTLQTCNKTLSILQPNLSRSSTLKRTSPPSSRRNSTRSTTQHGTASSVSLVSSLTSQAGTSALTLPTRPSTSSTSIWGRSPFCSSSRAEPHWLEAPARRISIPAQRFSFVFQI